MLPRRSCSPGWAPFPHVRCKCILTSCPMDHSLAWVNNMDFTKFVPCSIIRYLRSYIICSSECMGIIVPIFVNTGVLKL